ncbi:MAG: PilZ domain-containing protein [Kiloniellales bacterium]|nr:PilZ domain-containing protein [Kiloniellales bacterium]
MPATITPVGVTAVAVPERRRNARQSCNIKACVVQCGFEYACVLTNISAGGACLISPCLLEEMQLLRLEIVGFGGVTAVVRWTEDGETGVEFHSNAETASRLEDFLAQAAARPEAVVAGSC